MPKYYVNTNSQPGTGDYEVHTESCSYLRLVVSKIDLGNHSNCASAVTAAKRYYTKADGCYYCSPLCHQG